MLEGKRMSTDFTDVVTAAVFDETMHKLNSNSEINFKEGMVNTITMDIVRPGKLRMLAVRQGNDVTVNIFNPDKQRDVFPGKQIVILLDSLQ